MKRILLATLLAATTVAGGHEPRKAAAPVAKAARPAPALAEVIAVADRFGTALKAADFDAVRGLLDPAVVILESGGAERSADEYMGHHAIADAAFLGGATVKVTHRTGDVQGTLAWLATESEITPAAGSDGGPQLSTESMVLRKGPQGWRIAHIHWSSRPKKSASR